MYSNKPKSGFPPSTWTIYILSSACSSKLSTFLFKEHLKLFRSAKPLAWIQTVFIYSSLIGSEMAHGNCDCRCKESHPPLYYSSLLGTWKVCGCFGTLDHKHVITVHSSYSNNFLLARKSSFQSLEHLSITT